MRKIVARFADGTLTDALLRDLRIDSSVLCLSVMAPPWGFGVPAGEQGSFHVVLEGQGWLEVDGASEQIRIQAGDIALLPRGSAHWVRDAPGTIAPWLDTILANHRVIDGELRFGSDDGPRTEIVCGVFALEDRDATPWLDLLPPVLVAKRDHATDARRALASLLRDPARSSGAGSATVMNRLLESLLADAVRGALVDMGMDAVPHDQARADGGIRVALTNLHADPASRWTVQTLARSAAMSRSVFSDRFRRFVGETPMRYLAEVRLARAARLLRSTEATIAEIATSVGYSSEAALSRAFKARFGDPPSAFRRRVAGAPRLEDRSP